MPYKQLWASQDTYIDTSNATTNFGSVTSFSVQDFIAGLDDLVGLLEFDISVIPSNATVTEAILTLTNAQFGGGSQTQNIYPLVRDWVETEATWNIASTGLNWGTAGAKNTTTDYDNTTTVTIDHPNGQFNSATADIAAFVQDWVDGTATNHGLRLSDAATTTSVARAWVSRNHSIKAYWPTLEITYTYPAIGYAVNAAAITGGVIAHWPPLIEGQNADATPQISNWYPHRWEIPELEMADWITLYNLRGTNLTSVVTTTQETPNIGNTYTTARLLSVTGQQQGRRMLNVIVEFLIDRTS